MFEFLRSQKVYNVRTAEGSWSKVTARSQSEAIQIAQAQGGSAVDKVEYVRHVNEPSSDYERLHRR